MSGQPAPAGPPPDAAVDAALERLAEVTRLPPAERVDGYDEVQRRLAEALADAGSGDPGLTPESADPRPGGAGRLTRESAEPAAGPGG